MKKYILGIAGYIGSGKTTVAEIFEQHGAYFIDADKVVDELYKPGAAGYKKIQNFFGDEYLNKNGELNRKKLAKMVFNNPQKLKILNTIIHPLVTAEIQKKIDQSKSSFIVVEATYFEKRNLLNLVSAILWVECSEKILLNRLAKKKIDPGIFKKILKLQVKPAKIDFKINNNGTKEDLKKTLEDMIKKQINKQPVWKSLKDHI